VTGKAVLALEKGHIGIVGEKMQFMDTTPSHKDTQSLILEELLHVYLNFSY